MTVSIVEARNKFSELARIAESGEEVHIERHGKPCVRLSAEPPRKFEYGCSRLTSAERSAAIAQLATMNLDEPAFPCLDAEAPLP